MSDVMERSGHPPAVGAPDPERRTSPILDEESGDEEDLSVELEPETGVCYFNDIAYAFGDYVCSGDELLRCEERGVWVRKGSCRQI